MPINSVIEMETECPYCDADIELGFPMFDPAEGKTPEIPCPKCNRDVKISDVLPSRDITDGELTRLVLRMDERLFSEGKTPGGRLFKLPPRLASSRFLVTYSLDERNKPEIVERIEKIHRAYYRPKDTVSGGIHGGVYMFRDIPAMIQIPAIYGYAGINPFDCTDLSLQQLEWLCSFPEHIEGYLSTFSDLFDFAGCIASFGEYNPPTKDLALTYMQNAAFQIQSATATLCAAFDGRGAIQSSLLGAELSLKASLIEKGVPEDTLKKKYGHNLSKLVSEFGTLYNAPEIDCVSEKAEALPEYVESRYSPEQSNQRETGIITMNCQCIAGAVARAIGGKSIRSKTHFRKTVYRYP